MYHSANTYFLEMENFQLFNTLLTQLGNQSNLLLCGCPIHLVPMFPPKDNVPTMISQLNQQEQAPSGYVALQLHLIWPFTQTHHKTLQKMKYIVGYTPVMSYPYCWQPQEPPSFHIYFKSNHVTSQYSNLQPDKFMPTSLLTAMPPLNHAEYPTPQEAAANDNTEMRSVDSDETTLELLAERSAKQLRSANPETPDATMLEADNKKEQPQPTTMLQCTTTKMTEATMNFMSSKTHNNS
jgi:hypothetical protein